MVAQPASCAKGRLLIVVNVGWFFLSHRLPIAVAAKKAGYEVHVAAALDDVLDASTEARLASEGIAFHRMKFTRSGAHPFQLARDCWVLYRLFSRLRPDIVHLVTLKPILLGGLVARLVRPKGVVIAVPGRGSVFSRRGVLADCRRAVAILLYKVAYAKERSRVIVQNVEDGEYFISRGVFNPDDVRLIRGSGVDTAQFKPKPEPTEGLRTVVFASRMLKEKGVEEFVKAATELKKAGSNARFVLVGEPDHGNPHSHTRKEIESWVSTGAVEWWGHRSDMHEVFAKSHIVCLPTYYGEGVPKVLIEAAACGRAIVTTDIAGCRDIVRHRENGLLVKARDVDEMAAAIAELISNDELRIAMGKQGRRLVESEFSLDRVVAQTLALYSECTQ